MVTSFYTNEELKNIGLKSYGNNVLISRFARIYNPEKLSIGNNVRIDDFCILSGEITLGSNIHIAAYCGLYAGGSGIKIDDYSGLSSKVTIYAESDDYSGEYLTNPMVDIKFRNIKMGLVSIEKYVIIGSGSLILPSVTIKEGVAVGAMSMVSRNLKSWGIYFGIPAKRINERSQNLLKFVRE